MPAPYKKKPVQAIDREVLYEPSLTEDDWREFKEGIGLFNEHQFWHAHEAWESVWKRRPEESRVFFQGLVQLAAAYHLVLANKRYSGAVRNFIKAEEKLGLFPSRFMRVDVSQLLRSIRATLEELGRQNTNQLYEFDEHLVPTITLSDCSTPQ